MRFRRVKQPRTGKVAEIAKNHEFRSSSAYFSSSSSVLSKYVGNEDEEENEDDLIPQILSNPGQFV
jgi:hypothetical protein